MSVSDRIRQIEDEIDGDICKLKVWQHPKATTLTDLMQTYRDAIECLFVTHLFLRLHPNATDLPGDAVGTLFAQENRFRAGILWALKWASEFCSDDGVANNPTADELHELLSLGASYETLVDTLKYAQQGRAVLRVDEASKTLFCYEGEQATNLDPSIVYHQRITTPAMRQVTLTEDDDQITSRWTAGDYRRMLRKLADDASGKENEITVDPAYLAPLGQNTISIPQPTIVWLDRPSHAPDCHVFDDLVLPPAPNLTLKYKLVALLDNPIIMIGQRYCALSSDIKAVSQSDDHMLRLAARVDERQYTIANGLRESRMIKRCKDSLEQCSRPWSVKSNVHYNNPSQEADILAERDSDSLVFELKSTLRPETPWEVFKRNEDIIKGIGQAACLVARGVARHGFVVTDGYRGDYICWAKALGDAIPIGTLYDLEDLANNPTQAVSTLKSRVGIVTDGFGSRERMPDREVTLAGWTLRLIDGEAPDS